MGKFYAIVVLSFFVLLIINVVWLGLNIYLWAINGIQFLLQGMNFIERVYASIILKWIILADVSWLIAVLIFVVKRKQYKTNEELHYLTKKPIDNLKVSVVIPTYNESQSIENVINSFKSQKIVKHIIVVDNHSEDKTPDIAESLGVMTIRKEKNMGYAHSCVMGLKEFLKTDDDVVVLTEADETFSAEDINKMIPYLENCDLVIGTRQVQVLTEKGNQNSTFNIWGNWFLAKLVQIKYFSLSHRGSVQISDVGCSFRCIRRDALLKIIDKFTKKDTNEIVTNASGGLFALFMTIVSIDAELRLVEIPITFKKRKGASKTDAQLKSKGIIYGLRFFWYIIKS